MLFTGLIIGMTLLSAPENLLGNPGFEDLVVDAPARWECFVAPQEGAFGRLDNHAFTGAYSVMLHTPLPYAKEPCNNWSQNVIGEFGEKKLALSGYLKTKDATETAIWVQCWKKAPWGVLHVANSSRDMPVYGTQDWTRVDMTFDVPKGTDFLTVRCVIKGTGTAWFDDLSLNEVGEAAIAPGAMPPMGGPASPPGTSPSVPAPPAAGMAVQGKLTAVEDEVTRLRKANVAMAEALDRIQASNQHLMRELTSLRGQLKQLQETSGGGSAPAVPPAAVPPSPKEATAPPLVPHGADWRNLIECK